jgi:hypothetical protein
MSMRDIHIGQLIGTARHVLDLLEKAEKRQLTENSSPEAAIIISRVEFGSALDCLAIALSNLEASR